MRIVFLGGSITEGLGVTRSGKTYANLLKSKLSKGLTEPIEIINYGASAMQVNESRQRYEHDILEMKPELIVFAHGNTEAVVRERKSILRYMPRRWRKAGWMDPRPYYSSRFTRRCMEQMESAIRWRVKVLLIKVFGGKQWMDVTEFKQQTKEFVQKVLCDSPNTRIILLIPGSIEEKYFPGTPNSMEIYRRALKEIFEYTRASGKVFMCDSSMMLHQWDDYFADRFHPNENGHDKIAEALMETMTRCILSDSLMKEVAK
ncbi:SGNH/GDSL hydrolase family protein [Paenibacillus sp. F411]|uniref:SGNH/GDSL hydrolase family protein n=1 Tax=Paenibacillus sp. F411 TaxID=2820239 RepID=UPI001AAFED12|nr:SGNH/GDSL hydrolase family protein [Paenibacillus sp. F411]MBO2943795.1 SGNH/GDSL hydrolase family protein [Paenibacillus sp. F411]